MLTWAGSASAVLGALIGLWLVWVVAPRLTAPAASEADLRDVPVEARWQARDNRRKLQNDARTTALQGIAGFAVLAGAFFTYRQLRVARESQVTERFTRAIDQLGNENQDVRLGGIYALERIANDSPQDRAAIAEVLSAFVRGHAPWPPSRPNQAPEGWAPGPPKRLRTWAPDVQAALAVLGRRRPPVGRTQNLDLRATDLRHADLGAADLRAAKLAGAQLQSAFLAFAQLQDAHLLQAALQHAFMVEAQLQQAMLVEANLQGAYLQAANLHGAICLHAQMQGADLRGAQLHKAILTEAQLQAAKLQDAELQGARLGGAQLQEADLTGAQLQGARCNAETVWPIGFDWKAAGVKWQGD
jgi:uncharacterized protein YjbI with pentapeptide repeats